jgi:hypothetical protein
MGNLRVLGSQSEGQTGLRMLNGDVTLLAGLNHSRGRVVLLVQGRHLQAKDDIKKVLPVPKLKSFPIHDFKNSNYYGGCNNLKSQLIRRYFA